MKKVLPVITILAYLAAVIACIVNIIRGAEATLTTVIIFILYTIAVIVLMSLTTRMLIKNKNAKNEEEDNNDAPAVVVVAVPEAEKEEEEKNVEINQTVINVFVVNENTQTEAMKEAEADTEVVVATTEDAENASDDDNDTVVVAPIVIPADEEDDGEDDEEGDDDDDDEDDDDLDLAGAAILGEGGDDIDTRFAKSRYTRTYASKLIQADDELKSYYSIVKNAFMSYKKVTCSVSREHERVRRGRTTIGIIKVRGKSLLVYLALDPKQFENTMYVGDDVSEITKYAATPFLYRVKGPRKANRAARLIAMVAERFGLEATAEPANEDYVAHFPYETTEALIEKGLIIDNVAEAERKAEEARIAAEEAERAAHKAIEDAIKAKENALKVSEKSERTVDEIEAAEEARAAKADEN